jgi:hypothetical protein
MSQPTNGRWRIHSNDKAFDFVVLERCKRNRDQLLSQRGMGSYCKWGTWKLEVKGGRFGQGVSAQRSTRQDRTKRQAWRWRLNWQLGFEKQKYSQSRRPQTPNMSVNSCKTIGGNSPDGSGAWTIDYKDVDIEWCKQYGEYICQLQDRIGALGTRKTSSGSGGTLSREWSDKWVATMRAGNCVSQRHYPMATLRLYLHNVCVHISQWRRSLLPDTSYGIYWADWTSTLPWIIFQFVFITISF